MSLLRCEYFSVIQHAGFIVVFQDWYYKLAVLRLKISRDFVAVSWNIAKYGSNVCPCFWERDVWSFEPKLKFDSHPLVIEALISQNLLSQNCQLKMLAL